MNAFMLTKDDIVYTYVSSGLYQGNVLKDAFWSSDYIILGMHGKKYKKDITINDLYEDLDGIIIHSDRISLSEQCVNYLKEKGCEIYLHPEEIVYFKK